MSLPEIEPGLIIASLAVLLAVVAVVAMFRLRGGDATRDMLHRLADSQADLSGRLSTLSDIQAARERELAERLQAQERALSRTLEERLADVTRRVGDSLQKQALETANTMGDLKERLAVIGKAQENITKLSAEVVSLQEVLSNKQARGAFGETQLADQVRNALPPSVYTFQATLSNGARVDCLLKLPNPPGSIAIDAKFPLESYHELRNAKTPEERTVARRAFAAAVMKHVNDIAGKYLLPGETADSALMFLPSEAVYAELHAELPEVVDRSHRARVYIVSPTTLMATLNTIRAVLKDTQMREQAGLIQHEVAAMAEDVLRLDDRVAKLQRHFGQAEEDIRQIRVSTDKVYKRASRIQEVELEDQSPPEVAELPPADLPDTGRT